MSDRGHMRTRLAAAIATVVTVSACATPSTRPASEERRVSFDCGDHPGITVIFADNEARILSADGPPIVLPQRPSGSGIWYETPTHSLRGQGDEITYTIGRMVPIQCRAIRYGS
jgi:membrane-bound inhibitor of C-type lysozyme